MTNEHDAPAEPGVPPIHPQVLEQRYGWTPMPPPLPPRPRFQHRYWRHIVLFLLTVVTTYYAFLGGGWWYSLSILTILSAHEFGHYFACRYHRVDATLPYFIPAPPQIFLTGTFGAVIRIREAFPSKKALFDIGVAGPIAGFVALIPFLYFGLKYSQLLPVPPGDVLYFGEPLGLQALAWMRFGTRPEGMDIFLHPMGMGAWFGMLATALNLLPFGQLDGGHIMYALLGKRAARVSALTLLVAVLLTTRSLSWLVFTAMMIFMALTMGLRHPRVIDEDHPIGAGRTAVAIFAFVMFVLCFTPVPVEFLTNTPQ